MFATLIGIGLLATAGGFTMLLVASAVIGVGSAAFHPEASRGAVSPPADGSAQPSRPSRSAATPGRPSGLWQLR